MIAYIPSKSSQPNEFTVKFFKENTEEPARTEAILMSYEIVFGVDLPDQAALEKRVDEVMQELSSKNK